MKTSRFFSVVVALIVLTWVGTVPLFGQTNSPPKGDSASGQTNAPPIAESAPPPSAPPQKSQADLEKLVAPIALYPDPLIATVLPASAYPLEIVQAARFVKDTNNIAKLDAQEWDANVKAVAKFPDVIAQMDANISWTSDLGDAFINQPKELMDAIQTMRSKAQDSGALKTTSEQVVGMTNQIVTNVVETQTVVVTNQVIQIQPAQPEVIYVPQYNPTVVYSGYPVAYPGYYYPPPPAYYAGASLLSFGVGMATGAIIANNCDWGHGGVWGGGDVDVDIDQNVNVNRDVNRTRNVNENRTANANRQKWQPDQNRLKNSGSQLSSTQSRAARGYPTAASRSGSGAGAQRTASSAASSRPSSAGRPSSPGAGASRSEISRPSSSPNVNRQSVQSASRSEVSRPSSSASRPTPSSVSSRPSSSQRSAFSSSGGGGATRQASARGGGSRGGGGGRGGGGRR